MPALTLANLGLYAVQVALLIGALALTLAALRPGPAFRLAACRGLLVLLLLLPLQGLVRESPSDATRLDGPAAGVASAADAVDVRANQRLSWGAIAGGLLGLGIALRMAWLAVGLARLRRLAGDLPVEESAEIWTHVSELQDALGTNARVAFVDRVAQPVTFGIAPAVVLLPASLLAAPPDRRRAVLCHELLHVRRRDWLWVLGEELALTVLWFHPAAWWLIGELQLAREEVVDQLTVAATGARREYMHALFSAADLPSAPPLLSGFLRRRHLARRLVSLAEEVTMSRVRLAFGGALMAAVLAGSGAAALAAWPLTPMPQETAADRPEIMVFKARPDANNVRVVHRVEVDSPAVPAGVEFEDIVAEVQADVDETGGVSSARAATVTLHGTGGTQGSSAPIADLVQSVMDSAVEAVRQWRFEAPARTPASVVVRVRFDFESRRSAVVAVGARTGYNIAPVLEVGGAIRPPTKIVNVPPVYPQEAQDAKVQGVVIIGTVIDETGAVKEAWVIRSIPLLDQAALDAVRQWRYAPTLMNGVPRPVRMTSTVNFTLAP
jgi:TonB family protein